MSTSTIAQTIEVLSLINQIGAEELLDLLNAAAAKSINTKVDGKKDDKKKPAAPPAANKKPASKKPAPPAEDDENGEDDGEDGEEGEGEDSEGDGEDEDDAPPPSNKKKPAAAPPAAKKKFPPKKPTCPFDVGARVEFYDAESEDWGYASTIVEIDGNVITAQLDDDKDGDPVEVECQKDFSDVRALVAKKKKK